MITLSHQATIREDEIQMTAIRAQGAGGQHVNKNATAIHLRFAIASSSLPESYKQRLLAARHHLITDEGVVVIKAQEYRSREMNREAALTRLENLLRELTAEARPRRATRPGRAARARRMDAKSRRGEVKSLRGRVR